MGRDWFKYMILRNYPIVIFMFELWNFYTNLSEKARCYFKIVPILAFFVLSS